MGAPDGTEITIKSLHSIFCMRHPSRILFINTDFKMLLFLLVRQEGDFEILIQILYEYIYLYWGPTHTLLEFLLAHSLDTIKCFFYRPWEVTFWNSLALMKKKVSTQRCWSIHLPTTSSCLVNMALLFSAALSELWTVEPVSIQEP